MAWDERGTKKEVESLTKRYPAPIPSEAMEVIRQKQKDEAYEKRDRYAKGGMTASKRADGIAQRGKTRGTMVACGGGYMKGKK